MSSHDSSPIVATLHAYTTVSKSYVSLRFRFRLIAAVFKLFFKFKFQFV